MSPFISRVETVGTSAIDKDFKCYDIKLKLIDLLFNLVQCKRSIVENCSSFAIKVKFLFYLKVMDDLQTQNKSVASSKRWYASCGNLW